MTTKHTRAVVVEQLAELSLLTQEDPGSNSDIGKFDEHLLL